LYKVIPHKTTISNEDLVVIIIVVVSTIIVTTSVTGGVIIISRISSLGLSLLLEILVLQEATDFLQELAGSAVALAAGIALASVGVGTI
jgi:hypothetical protein